MKKPALNIPFCLLFILSAQRPVYAQMPSPEITINPNLVDGPLGDDPLGDSQYQAQYEADIKKWGKFQLLLTNERKKVETSKVIKELNKQLNTNPQFQVEPLLFLTRFAGALSDSQNFETFETTIGPDGTVVETGQYAGGEEGDASGDGGAKKQNVQIAIESDKELGRDIYRIDADFLKNDLLQFTIRIDSRLKQNCLAVLLAASKLSEIFKGYIPTGDFDTGGHAAQNPEPSGLTHHFAYASTLDVALGLSTPASQYLMQSSAISTIEYAELQFNARHGRINSQLELLNQDLEVIQKSTDALATFFMTKGLSQEAKNEQAGKILEILGIDTEPIRKDKLYLSLWLKMGEMARSRMNEMIPLANAEKNRDEENFRNLKTRLSKNGVPNLAKAISESDYQTVANLFLKDEFFGLRSKNSAFTPSVQAVLLRYAETIETMATNPASLEWVQVFRGLDAEDMVNLYGIKGKRAANFLPSPVMARAGYGPQSALGFVDRYLSKPTRNAMVKEAMGQRERLISRLFASHAGEPVGSFYLSTSKAPTLAKSWADSGYAIINIPKALAPANAMSYFVNELENLAFIIFPGPPSAPLVHVTTREDFACVPEESTVSIWDPVTSQALPSYKKMTYSCTKNEDLILANIEKFAPNYQGGELNTSKFFSSYFGQTSEAYTQFEKLFPVSQP